MSCSGLQTFDLFLTYSSGENDEQEKEREELLAAETGRLGLDDVHNNEPDPGKREGCQYWFPWS